MVSDSSYSQDSFLSAANTTDCVSGPYGYLTREQYESDRQAQTTFYYNMVKDFVAPNLQMHCTTLVHTQYRKNDHVWFSFSPSMRYSFYECVEITPVIPMHWVKVGVVSVYSSKCVCSIYVGHFMQREYTLLEILFRRPVTVFQFQFNITNEYN